MVKFSAQSEHFSALVRKVSHSKFRLFKPIFRHLDPESGSGFLIRIRIPDTALYLLSFRVNKLKIKKFHNN